MNSKNRTIDLLRQIGSPYEISRRMEIEESRETFDYAFKNRLGLLYLEKLKKAGKLVRLEDEWRKLSYRSEQTRLTAERVSNVLGLAGISHVVFKTFRPFPATPNDVDILCLEEPRGFEEAKKVLLENGYFTFDKEAPMQILFSDPRGKGIASGDKSGGIYYVDLYKAPAADYFRYLDSKKLALHVERRQIGEKSVSTLKEEIELAAILMHSVFPESTYTLEVFYSMVYSFDNYSDRQINDLVKFVKDSRLTYAVRACISLTLALHKEAFGLRPERMYKTVKEIGGELDYEARRYGRFEYYSPYRISPSSFFLAFIEKTREPSAFISLLNQGLHMMDPRFFVDVFKSLVRRLTRNSYEQT